MRERTRVLTVLSAVLAATLTLVAVARTPLAQAGPVSVVVVFTYTGAPQTWTVPPGVTQASVDMGGASGGGAGTGIGEHGFGARVAGTLALTPGSTVTIMVGEAGQGAGPGDPPRPATFNGGGAGGAAGPMGGGSGGSGGGATDIRIGGTGLQHRMLVAGGGGGNSRSNRCSSGNTGGNGGGLTGGDATCGGATGGNQNGTTGSGQLGQGGAGATAIGAFDGGGGGGGGYYGGAGGVFTPGVGSTGGGGGSSFGPPGTFFDPGVIGGDGRVELSYTIIPNATAMRIILGVSVDGRTPPAGTFVEAKVGTTRCGQGETGVDGRLLLEVVTAGQIPGCGTNGAALSFEVRRGSASATPPVSFLSGGLSKSTLIVGTPPAPMQVSGTITGGAAAPKRNVEALVNGQVCGTAVAQNGAFRLIVASATSQPGCALNGNQVSFRVDGQAATGSVTFASGGSAMVTLQLP